VNSLLKKVNCTSLSLKSLAHISVTFHSAAGSSLTIYSRLQKGLPLLYVCICVYMYVCVCVYIYRYIYIYAVLSSILSLLTAFVFFKKKLYFWSRNFFCRLLALISSR
jgi:hypothetical protein